MNGFAPLLAAIALAQDPAAGPPPGGAPAGAASAPEPASVDSGHPPSPSLPPVAPAAEKKATRATASTPLTPSAAANEGSAAATAPKPSAAATAPKPSTRSATPAPTAVSGSAAVLPASISPTLPAPADRSGPERVARAFVAALVKGDAEELAALSAERFSFDGDPQSGREAVLRTWRALLAGRTAPAPVPGRLEVVTLAEAVARHGKPPVRLESVARPGALVAIADVGGRTVVLFLEREAGRFAVTGMHD